MIVEFGVRNFGPIKDLQVLSMEATSDRTLEEYYVVETAGERVLKLVLLYGPNASGKTTFLKALDFLRDLVCAPANHKGETLDYTPFLFDPKTPEESSALQLAFVAEDILHRYQVEFNRKQVLSEKLNWYPKGREALFFERYTDTGTGVVTVAFGSTVDLKKRDEHLLVGNSLENVTVLGAFGKTNVDAPELRAIFHWFSERLMPVVFPADDLTAYANTWLQRNEAGAETFVDLIKRADLQITRVQPAKDPEPDAEPGDPALTDRLQFLHTVNAKTGGETGYLLKANQESRGTMRMFGIAAHWTDVIAKGNLLGFDEFETSLHPELAEHLILTLLASAQSGQVILTTHDLLLLGNRDILRHDAVWFTHKNQEGSTELYSAADFDTSVIRKKESLLNAYKLGKLGARPIPGSIFIFPEKESYDEN